MDESTLVEVEWTVYETRQYRRRVTLGELWVGLDAEAREEAERQAAIPGHAQLGAALVEVDADDVPALVDSEDGGGAERVQVASTRELGSARVISWPVVVPVRGD